MALFENKVITKYIADTEQERRAIDDLIRKNEQLKAKESEAARAREQHFDALVLDLGRAARAEQELIDKQIEARNEADKARKSSGVQIDSLIKGASMAAVGINQALELMGKAAAFAQDAIKGWGEDLRLEAVNAGISIDRLGGAFQGLVDDDALNQFAAKSANGALKLTQQQMETVGQAAVALREKGFDLTRSLEALTDAAVTGRTKGLRELGISAEEGSNRIQTVSNLMTELNKVIADSHGPISKQADDIERLAVAWNNAIDSAKNYAAQAILSASAAINAEEMARGVFEQNLRKGALERLASGDYNMLSGGAAGQANLDAAFYGGLDRGRSIQQQQQQLRAFIGGHLKSLHATDHIEMDEDKITDGDRKRYAKEAADRAARAILESAVMSVDRNVADVVGGGDVALRMKLGLGPTAYDGMGAAAVSNYEGFAVDERALLDRINERSLGAYNEMTSRDSRYADSATRRNKPMLEEVFGPVDDFNLYAEAFDMLGGAVTSAMNAWIDGSMSAGEAVKKFLADALKGLASQMAIESLKHGAYALGSLAFGDVRGAGTHAAAAAAFGAGAAAAAVAAKGLGGGGAQPSAAGGASAGGGSAGASGGSFGNGQAQAPAERIIVIMGDAHSQSSPRMTQLNAERVVDLAFGGEGVTSR